MKGHDKIGKKKSPFNRERDLSRWFCLQLDRWGYRIRDRGNLGRFQA